MEDNSNFVNKTFHGWKTLKEALVLLKVSICAQQFKHDLGKVHHEYAR